MNALNLSPVNVVLLLLVNMVILLVTIACGAPATGEFSFLPLVNVALKVLLNLVIFLLVFGA